MTTVNAASMPVVSPASNFSVWNDATPKIVSFEDCLGQEANSKAWEKLYAATGLKSPNEKERRSVRAAVYVYCAKNGTSREGEYSGTFVLAGGQTVDAAVIPRAAGKMKIRKFLRANMIESYIFFKETGVMEQDDRFVAKAAAFGISAECAFAMADWLDDCPMFTPAEAKAHTTVFNKSIDRSKRARGGKTLETIEDERVTEGIEVNGPAYDHTQKSNQSW